MKAQIVKCFLAALVSSLTLASCANTDDKTQDPNQNPVFVGPEWNINEVNVTCENESLCPDNQGILLTVKRRTEVSYFTTTKTLEVYRCTATLYAADKIVTAGHCADDFAGVDEIWFKTVDKPGRPGQTFRVSHTPLAQKSPPKGDLMQIDYAGAQLLSRATGITFAHPAQQVPADISEMVALVINAKPTAQKIARQYILNAVTCRQGATGLDPIDYAQNPDKFMYTDCKLFGGNSGGAIVSKQDPLSILGIVSTSNHAKSNEENSPPVELTGADNVSADEIVDFGSATNARCFSMPAWPQTSASCTTISADVLSNASLPSLLSAILNLSHEWFADSSVQTPLAATGLSYFPTEVRVETNDLLHPEAKGFAMVPIPVCVNSELPMGKTVRLTIRPSVYAINPHSNRLVVPRFQALTLPVQMDIEIQHQSGDNYLVHYVLPWSGFDKKAYSLKPAPKSALAKLVGYMGESRSIPKCKGNEAEVFFSQMQNEIAAKP